MKTNPTIFSKIARRTTLLTAVFGIAVAFTACKTDIQQPEAVGFLAVTNASPTATDFLLDNQKVNNNALAFGTKLNYFRVFAGKRSASVAFNGATGKTYTKSIDVAEGYSHSLYIVSQKDAATQQDTLSFVYLKDESKLGADGNGKVRFLNLSSDSPALDLVFETDTTTFNNVAFKGNTAFKTIPVKKYTLTLKNRATGTPVATLADVQIDRDRFYTVWAKGLATTTVDAQKLAIKVDVH